LVTLSMQSSTVTRAILAPDSSEFREVARA
jgi:hypothetical protein